MKNYEQTAYDIYFPVIQKYNLQFVTLEDGQFFLIGDGFALWIFVDIRDRRADTWYISVDEVGNVQTYTLMYINKQRFTLDDRACYGKPTTFDEVIKADMRVLVSGLLNHCKDILTGEKNWLRDYQGKGHYYHHITKFLAPYFRAQGYPVIIKEEI